MAQPSIPLSILNLSYYTVFQLIYVFKGSMFDLHADNINFKATINDFPPLSQRWSVLQLPLQLLGIQGQGLQTEPQDQQNAAVAV